MCARNLIHSLFGVALVGVMATSPISAMNAGKMTYFTFSKAVQLPGVSVPAGTYIFEVVNPDSSVNVVRVASRDRSKVYLLQVTRPVERPRTRDMKSQIVFGEVPAGQPPRVTSWFPDGETLGRSFIY